MPTPTMARFPVHLGMASTSTKTRYAAPGIAGRIVEVNAVVPKVATAGSLVVSKNTTALHASIDLSSALVAGTGEEVTLTATGHTLDVAASDIFKAVWTIGTAGDFVGGDVIIWIEPATY